MAQQPIVPFDTEKAVSSTLGSAFDVWDGTYTTTLGDPMPTHFGHNLEAPTAGSSSKRNMVDTTTYAISHLPSLSHEQLRALQEQLFKAGYISQKAVTGEFNSVTKDGYDQFLKDVAAESLRSQPITPDDYMRKILGGDGTGDQPTTSTSTSVASSQDARTLALSTFQSLLGRRPSQHEMDAFYAALTSYDRAHPTVSTGQQDAAGNSTSTTTGGANNDAFAQGYVEQNYGGQEGQHDALHYFDLVNQNLTGPPGSVHHADTGDN